MNRYTCLIIGAGASGTILSILLKRAGIDCALIESQDRILKKLLVTGNGRCNITNSSLKNKENIGKYFSSNSNKKLIPLYDYSYYEYEYLFLSLGIPFTELEEGKIYPASLQASSVVDIIRCNLEELGINIYTANKITSINRKKDLWYVNTKEESFTCENLILATGGLAMPQTGSDGSINKFLKVLSINMVKQEAALVQLKSSFSSLKALSGVKCDAKISLYHNDALIDEESGELLFTDYGLSGPPILQLSRYAALRAYKDLSVKIDLFPKISKEELLKILTNMRDSFKKRQALHIFSGIINKKMIPVFLKMAGLEKMTHWAEKIDDEILKRLVDLLKELNMDIIGHNGFNNAQSTLGGVSLGDIDLSTMESNNHKGLYFLGEVLDVCGACGGYNLSWAWSSALCCSRALINKIIK